MIQEHFFENFESYALSEEETRLIQGGGLLFNQQIFALLCERASYGIPYTDWRQADFRFWAYKLEVSINTLKNWLKEGKNPNTNAQKQILKHLDLSSWEALEQNIISKTTKKPNKIRQ